MEYNYTTLMADLESWPEDGTADPEYVAAIPNIIAFGEDRLINELNLENLEAELDADIVSGSGEIVKPDELTAVRTLGYLSASGVYIQLQRMTPEFVRKYAAEAAHADPRFYAEYSETVWSIAPIPTASYDMDLRATAAPAGLDASSPTITTWISRKFPQLLLQSCLMSAHQYLKNDGRWGSVKTNYDLLMPDAKAQVAQLRKTTPEDQIYKRVTVRPENDDAQPQNQ